jgi:hypothetical protein
MLKLTWIEFFFSLVPEMLIFTWGIYVVTRELFNVKNYILSSIVMALLVFLVRELPIYFGVHMIINIIVAISFMVFINIPIVKAIYSTLLMFFILSISEFLNIILLGLLKIDVNNSFTNPVTKCTFTIPSLIFFILFIIVIDYYLKKKEGIKIGA